jgi:hypothetical protein
MTSGMGPPPFETSPPPPPASDKSNIDDLD